MTAKDRFNRRRELLDTLESQTRVPVPGQGWFLVRQGASRASSGTHWGEPFVVCVPG